MLDVAIIGAGELGSIVAHTLARRDRVSSIRLIDEREGLATGVALDLLQAAAVHGGSTRVAGSRDLLAAAGATIVVIADPPSADGRAMKPEMATLRRVMAVAPRATVIGAGSSHRELVEEGVRAFGMPRERIVGTAPEALASAIRACVALEANVSAREVSLTVLGTPPRQTVVPWQEASAGGRALTRILEEPALRRLAARVELLWPPGPSALAAAAALAIEAMGGHSRRTVSCFVGPDDSMGARSRTVALPVRLGLRGVVAVALPVLNVSDQVALENAMLL
jgi:malate/lactate dehydrogenase